MMVTSMKYRDVEAALLAHACRWREGKGDHRVWYCPCGQHMVVTPRARVTSPGVVRDVIKRMSCLPKGWLQ